MITVPTARLECSFTDRSPSGQDRADTSWADVVDIYAPLALAVRFYPQWCKYAVLKRDQFHFFTLIPNELILQDLIAQGYEVVQTFGIDQSAKGQGE